MYQVYAVVKLIGACTVDFNDVIIDGTFQDN